MRPRDLEKNRSGEGWVRRNKIMVAVGSLAVVSGFALVQGFQAVYQAPTAQTQSLSIPQPVEKPASGPSELVARVRVSEGVLHDCGDTRVVRVLELRESGRGSETIHREQLSCSAEVAGEASHRMVARFQMGRQAFAIDSGQLTGLINTLGRRIDDQRGIKGNTSMPLSEQDQGIQIWWGKGAYEERRSKLASADGGARSVTLPTFQARGESGQQLFDDLVRIVSEHAEMESTRRVITR